MIPKAAIYINLVIIFIGTFFKFLKTGDYFYLCLATIDFSVILYFILKHLSDGNKEEL
jgi:hypothetical protein